MQNVLSSVTKDCAHCTFPASFASAPFEVAAALLSCSRLMPPTPGRSRSITYRFIIFFRLRVAGGAFMKPSRYGSVSVIGNRVTDVTCALPVPAGQKGHDCQGLDQCCRNEHPWRSPN